MSNSFPQPGDLFAGKYRIKRRLGRGGFAQVYLAVQAGLDREVAIKMFDPRAVGDLSDEETSQSIETSRSGDDSSRRAADSHTPNPKVAHTPAGTDRPGAPGVDATAGETSDAIDDAVQEADDDGLELLEESGLLEEIEAPDEASAIEEGLVEPKRTGPPSLPSPASASGGDDAPDDEQASKPGLSLPKPGSGLPRPPSSKSGGSGNSLSDLKKSLAALKTQSLASPKTREHDAPAEPVASAPQDVAVDAPAGVAARSADQPEALEPDGPGIDDPDHEIYDTSSSAELVAEEHTGELGDLESVPIESGLGEVSSMAEISTVEPVEASNSGSPETLQAIVRRFEREAQVVSQLRSPYTVTIHDYGQTDDGMLYMVMEFVDGRRFDELDVPMAADRVCNILRQVLLSLREAHAQGLLHRDLKPANLMLFDHAGAHDQVKLLDFGIAKIIGGAKSKSRPREDLTDADVLIGTPRYMAPEQILGEDIGPPADIYAIGLVIYELITGTRAVDSDDDMEILAHHVRPQAFQLPSDAEVPPRLRRIVNRMLQKDLRKRYDSVSDVLNDLDRLSPSDVSHVGMGKPSGSLAPLTEALERVGELTSDALSKLPPGAAERLPEGLFRRDNRRAVGTVVVSASAALLLLFGAVAFSSDGETAAASEDAQPVAIGHGVQPAEPETAAPAEPAEPSAEALEAVALAEAEAEAAAAEEAEPEPPPVIMTRVATEPAGAVIYINDESFGQAPLEFGSDRVEFPATIRAVNDQAAAETTIDGPGDDVLMTIEMPEPEPTPRPAPKPEPKPTKPKYNYEPLE